jgi:integrase
LLPTVGAPVPGGRGSAEPGGGARQRRRRRRLDFLFCWENGKPPHPDTITRRFKRLAKAADLPEIDLHDVRHSYATAGRNAKIDWKALSKRIGHADVAFTMRQYVQTDLEADREVANTLADLIIGGLLVTEDTTDDHQADEPDPAEEA